METSKMVERRPAFFIEHFNLDYAEFSPKQENQLYLIKNSYIPTLQFIVENNCRFTLNLTGKTLETLQSIPEGKIAIDYIREGIDKGLLEITGTLYHHPLAPMLTREEMEIEIVHHRKLLKELFGYEPVGFWLPEMAWTPEIAPLLVKHGYQWLTLDHDHLQNSNQISLPPYFNDFLFRAFDRTSHFIRRSLRWLKVFTSVHSEIRKDYSPVSVKGKDAVLFGVQAVQAWSNLLTAALSDTIPFKTMKTGVFDRVLRGISRRARTPYTLYMSDAELFCNPDGNDEKLMLTAGTGSLEALLDHINKYFYLIHPREYFSTKNLSDFPEVEPCEGSWGLSIVTPRGLDVWTQRKENRELIKSLDELRGLMEKLPYSEENQKLLEEYLHLRGSDNLGWNPHPERVAQAFERLKSLRERVESIVVKEPDFFSKSLDKLLESERYKK